MLKLEKLEISGFKSFADKTVLMFGEGITGVVGPNGCGKSNIAESISWVLGEQSAKNLRGSKMEDVIFNGTRDRKPQGAAEVTLTLLATADIASRDSEEDTGDDESRFDAAIVSAGRAAAAAKSLIEGAEKVEGVDPQPSTESTAGSAESIGAQPDEAVAATDGAPPEPAEKPRRSRKRGRIVVQAGERVTVGRRLYRTGDSDYLMNGRACLLRDIQDLFAGTGLGGAHYAIIEQGRIGQILSSKPLDRRGLIEEAAGITKFKSRKRLAELKLESAKQNLTRLNDIISEIERQVNSLKRQAAKARRYRRLREEMRSLLKLVFAADYYRLTHAAEEIARQLEEASSAVSEAAARVTERETENRAVATEARAAEDHLASLKEQAAAVGLDADRARNRRAFEEQQIKELSARLDENGRIQAGLTERLGLLDAQIEKKGGELGGLKSEVSAEQAELLKKESDYQADVSRVRAAEKHIEGLRQKLFIEVAKAERVTNALASLEDALRRLDLRQTNLNAELERATEKRQEAQAQSTGMQAEVDAGRAELEDLKIRIDDSACVLQSVREETRGLQSRLDAVQTERAGAQHRLTSLEDVDARHAYYSDAVQQVLSPDQSARINAMGTLADFVHVADSRYERLIESLFGRELQSVLVPTIDDALTGVEYIRTEGLGRGAFLVVGLHGAEGEPSDYFLESSPSIEASAPQETNGGYTPSVIIDPGHLLAAASVSGPEGGSSALARPGTGTIPEYTAEPAKTEAASGPAANEDESSDSIPQSASAGPEIDTEAELKNLAKDVVQLYVDYCTDYNSQADTGAEASADASPDLHGSRVTGLVESADDGASTYGELGFAGEDAGVPPGVIFDQASFYSGACEPVREFGASHGDSLPAPATDSDRSQGSPESANDGATAVPLTEAIGQSENDVFASAAVSDRPGSFLVHEGESDSSEAACQAALTPGDHAFSADDDAVAAAGSPPVPALQEPDSMDAAGQPAETASELVELVASPSTPAWMQETSEHSNGSGGSSDGSREAPLPDTLLKDPSPASTARNGNGASMHFELEVLRAVDLMGLRAEIKPVVERAFPDKCGASVVPDVEAALQLSMESGWRTYVTYDGEQVVNGRLIVTSAQAGQQGASLLAIKREIKQLSGMTATLLANETVLAESLAVCRVRLEQEEAAAAALDGELRKAEKMAASRESQLVSLERELERAEQHVRVVAAELDQAAEERAELELKIEELAADVLRAEGARNLASHSLTAAQAEFVIMRQEVEQLADTLSKSRATAAARVERLRAAESEMRRLEGESDELNSRINTIRLELYEIQNRLELLKVSYEEGGAEAVRLEAETARLGGEVAEAAQHLGAVREKVDELEAELAELRRTATAAHDRKSEIEVERAKTESEAEHLTRSCFAELALSLQDVVASVEAEATTPALEEMPEAALEEAGETVRMEAPVEAPVAQSDAGGPGGPDTLDSADSQSGAIAGNAAGSPAQQLPSAQETFDVDAAKARLDELRRKLDDLGSVNMMALEELEESEQRFQFLSGQRTDILKSIKDTEDAITEIKRRSRERFRQAFTQVNENFQKMFLELFGGGRGEMILIDEEDVLESGIDLIAQPPGKRLQNVLLLSGGEKAMAALALVLAIFQYRPSPFCILDEVDAPLDEVNVGRFADKVAQMSQGTQFLMITHNKRSMESARALYGVTMEEPGVSKLVSVRFD